MNDLLREAAQTVDFGWVLGGVTIVFLGVFLAWAWWAYTPKNREKWEEAARMPFTDGGDR